ncbi:t-SNARE coiled-coil domain-containing protein [Citrus sinensis]|uniref:t-SNARE coiled-coil domain-containing protein n=1 Tax=Citrus sinensis TaxID=2711 RepID=A0ACB8KIR9_CITSI|nr:t-SNARE coiled-coil domain-containing protein [Citrus sinensis]
MANKQYLVVDAWLREAQEAEKLVEEIDGRVKNKSQEQQQQSLSDDIIARSKLLEVGVKLDRLESLLRNPPSKPILTNEDLESRWKMLSDIQLRMKALAVRLYAMPYPMPRRQGGLPAADTRETDINADSYDQGQIRASFAKDESELLQPLVVSL